MNLKTLSKDELLKSTKRAVEEERRMTLLVLQHLQEVNRRRLYAELRYGSLHEYAVKDLGYSDHEAHSRIQAMRLLNDVPEVEEKIIEGSLSLTNATKIQSFFYRAKKKDEALAPEEKIELIERLENTSTRECERELCRLDPQIYVQKEKQRPVTEDLTEYRFALNTKQRQKVEKAKSLLSHVNPNPSMAELLELLCDKLIQQKDPARERRTVSPARKAKKISAATKRKVWQRDESCCSFEVDGKRCGATHLLQTDHVIPLHYGGTNEPENLRLLCFTHHKLVTEVAFKH